jgi:hypothetical protein
MDQYTVMDRAPHTLHECSSARQFLARFQSTTGCTAEQAVGQVVSVSAPKAVFLVGSLPLGMATHGSDIDLIVLVDDKAALQHVGVTTNTQRQLVFLNDSDSLRLGEYLRVFQGVLVDIAVVVAPSVARIYSRLRSKGPELSEGEILILGRLATGWLLWQSDHFLEERKLSFADCALDVYCSTRSYVSSLHLLQKAFKALEFMDVPLALQLGRSSVEAAYLAYFASEGYSYLGVKWLAQIGHARGAADRLERHPLLAEGVPLLFPAYGRDVVESGKYLQTVAKFLGSLRGLIEQKTLFRIAFQACPQIHAS